MPQKPYDILAVGNAIIDVFSQCDDDFLQQHAIEKGGMNLVESAASKSLLAAISAVASPHVISGGSAAIPRLDWRHLAAKRSLAVCMMMNLAPHFAVISTPPASHLPQPRQKWLANCLVNYSGYTRCGVR